MQKTTIYLKEIEGEKMRNKNSFKVLRVLVVVVLVVILSLCVLLPLLS
ncbi:MAG TPA: hypothetical protein PKL88_00575 [bacterium]|nr:hypothetical protein [bacterium]